jgi:tryptophan-rich sensory protein
MDALVIAVSAMAPALIRETNAIEEDAILITFCLVWPFYAFSETSRLPGLLGNIGVLLLAAFAVWQLWPVSRPAAIMIAPVAIWITIATVTILDGARRYG